MDVQTAYNEWAEQYDSNENKTRDLEAFALRKVLEEIPIGRCLEIGCGTGKNTEWLASRARHVTAVDLSEEMLALAKKKLGNSKVEFIRADILQPWDFANGKYDLVTFSLVLEHIQDLDTVFMKCAEVLEPSGLVYLGELHPFKQYSGSKARFETTAGIQQVNCFNHHISDFSNSAGSAGFEIIGLSEYFDNNDRNAIPRILAMLFRRQS